MIGINNKQSTDEYKELWEAVWPIVVLRIVATLVVWLIVLSTNIDLGIPMLLVIFALYLAVYAYGGYRAVSKFGYSVNKSLVICGAIGILAAGIVSWKGWSGDLIQYVFAIFGEGIVAVIGGFVGASIARMRKK